MTTLFNKQTGMRLHTPPFTEALKIYLRLSGLLYLLFLISCL